MPAAERQRLHTVQRTADVLLMLCIGCFLYTAGVLLLSLCSGIVLMQAVVLLFALVQYGMELLLLLLLRELLFLSSLREQQKKGRHICRLK